MQFLNYGLKHYKYKFCRWNPRPGSLQFSHVCTDYKKNWERKSLKLRKLNNLRKKLNGGSLINKENIRKMKKERIKKLRILHFTTKHKNTSNSD